MKSVIRWTLHQRRWYTIWWTFGVTVFVAVQLGFYPSFKGQFDSLNKTLSQLPAGVKGLIGDNGNYFSAETYLNSRVFYLVVPLLLVILMIGVGSSLLAREERSGTLELLLSRPISRAKLLAGKAISGLFITGCVTIVSLIVCIILSKAVGIPNSVAQISAAMLLTYMLCLVYGSFAFMLTAIGGKAAGYAVGLTTFIFAGGYVLAGLESAVEWLRWPAKLFPYHYFNPQNMLLGKYTWTPVLSFALASAVFYTIGWFSFRRRDIG
jgi:ABC-2 type transport system permease protein